MTLAVNLATVGSNATATGTLLTAGTAVASTSGTSIDFTSIPSWVKRITVMLKGVSTNGTSDQLVQIGSGSVTTSGYLGAVTRFNGATPSTSNVSAGYLINGASGPGATAFSSGVITIYLLTANTYIISGVSCAEANVYTAFGSCQIPISGVLDRVRITTANGTDTFDAGSINILYE